MRNEGGYSEELRFAQDCARELGELIRNIAGSGYEVEHKKDGSFVTTADRKANRRFIERTSEQFPHDRVLGEEESRPEGGGPRTWVIDPLDGTLQFLLRIPVWTVAIALTDESGRPVLGVVCNPSLREGAGSLYWAVEGGGAFCDHLPIHVSKRDASAGAVWIRGEAAEPTSSVLSGTLLEVAFAPRLRVTERRVLPAAFASCLVAEGRLDGVVFTGGGAHDLAAGCVIVREAGGMVTDLSGADQRYDRQINGGVLSNRLIHGDLLQQLACKAP